MLAVLSLLPEILLFIYLLACLFFIHHENVSSLQAGTAFACLIIRLTCISIVFTHTVESQRVLLK